MNKWRVLSISEICTINRKSINKNDSFSTILYLDTSNLTRNKIDSLQELIYDNNIPSRAKRKVKQNTIIYSSVRPDQEHFGIIKNPFANLIVSTGFITLDVSDDTIDSSYLYYNITRTEITKYLHQIALNSVSAYPSIIPNDLGKLKIKVPSLTIQQRIASVLSSLDNKIELNNKINAELEAMAKTLYDYWFVQFNFPDVNGKPYRSSSGKMVYNEKLKREIPEGWKVKELSQIANITMGQSPDGKSYNDNGEGIIFYQGSTDFGIRFPSVRQFTTAPTRFAKKGDILLSVRAPVGTFNLANTNCCIGRGLAAINSKINSICYLYQLIRGLKQVFDRRNVDGTTFGSITKDDLYSLNVIVPKQDILDLYQKTIFPTFNKQDAIQQENQQLSSLRDWLLPMLMNGQVGFKDEIQP